MDHSSVASGEKYYAAGRALSTGRLGAAFKASDAPEVAPEQGNNAFEISSSLGKLTAQMVGLQISLNNISADQANVAASSSAASQIISSLRDREETQAKQRTEDYMYQLLLDRIQMLEKRMAESAERLKDKYGDNFIDGMAAAYLSEEEIARAKTDDEKLDALASKMLNPDGSIKSEYAGSEEAAYIKDWKEAQKLKPLAEKYNGQEMTVEDKKAWKEELDRAGYSSIAEVARTSENIEAIELQDTAIQKISKTEASTSMNALSML